VAINKIQIGARHFFVITVDASILAPLDQSESKRKKKKSAWKIISIGKFCY
jgi:hypothetical protein